MVTSEHEQRVKCIFVFTFCLNLYRQVTINKQLPHLNNKVIIMNSPNFRQVSFNPNHDSRFYNRVPVTQVNHNNSVFVPYIFQNGYTQQKAAVKTMPDVSQGGEFKQKQVENVNKNEVRSIYDKKLVNSTLFMQARTSDMSVHSLKQEEENMERVNCRLKTINDQLTSIFSKLTIHDKQIQQLSEKTEREDENKNLQFLQKIQDIVLKKVEKQIAEQQQQLSMQNKLIKADLDTLKLEMMCLVDKKQLKEIDEKNHQSQKVLRKLIKQVQQKSSQEVSKILEKRKIDIQRFETEVEEMKGKLMDISSIIQKKSQAEQICLVKSLSFKVLHEMQVYNEKELKWIELGTGQTIYGIDGEGYLLDNKDRYITDEQGNLIKLEQNQQKMLKKHGLIR